LPPGQHYSRRIRPHRGFGSRIGAQNPGGGGFGVNSVGRVGVWKIRPAPSIILPFYEGPDRGLLTGTAEATVVNFWGSWCPPCRQEAPAMERVWRASRDHG